MSGFRMVNLGQVLTQEMLDAVLAIGDDPARVDREVIAPNIGGINERLGQENDPRFIAHAVCMALRGAGAFSPPSTKVRLQRTKPDMN